jgi:hypothetical protein
MTRENIGGKETRSHFEDYRGGNLPDPYISGKGLPEPTICPTCEAVYHKKHWRFDKALLTEAKKNPKVHFQKCPADRKIEDHYAMGKVLLSGAFINEHLEELVNIVKSEERMAKENNPLDRLMLVEKRNGGLYVETTSDALATRIGHHLKKSYKGGDEDFKFRLGDKFVEIHWHRD